MKKEKMQVMGLGVVIVATILFLGTLWMYMEQKEVACGKNLYSTDCYRDYGGFVKQYVGLK